MIYLAITLDIFLILFSLKYVWWYKNKDMSATRIMMYHMIAEQIPNEKKSGLRVSPLMFEKHLEYFSNNGWKFIKMSELDEHKDQNKTVAITFDDGYLDNYSIALPLLKKYNACATLYLVIDRHNNDWSVKKNPKHNSGALALEEKLSDDHILEMLNSNVFELGGHTITHPYLPNLSFEDKKYEMIQCKEILENKFNTQVTSFAYPFGIYSNEDINIIKGSDYSSAVTTEEGVADNSTLFDLKRIKASGKDNFFAFKLRVLKGFRGFI
jgi:peptidoglycan/xylan/chitin deacetylase (PgdA/CDA1 family)